MKILAAGAVLSLALALQTSTQQSGGGKNTKNDNCGILYGDSHALTFCAADGWVLDTSIMNDQGIYAVFYPDGSNWHDATHSGTFMYINVVGRKNNATIAEMIDADADGAKRSDPTTVVTKSDPIRIGDVSVPVLRFGHGPSDYCEATAYIGEEKVLVMLVISSKNEQLFAKDYPAFVKLVQSYHFLTSTVTFQHK